MVEHFYLFSELNRDSKPWTIEAAYAWKGGRIISMGDDEDAYLFSMQLMIGEATIIPFQKFHDDYWDDLNYKQQALRDHLHGTIFCTHPGFLDYMMDYQGDLKWLKEKRTKEEVLHQTIRQRDLKIFL
ncbi:hypothetical protein D3C87_1232370 [compost metagenome]